MDNRGQQMVDPWVPVGVPIVLAIGAYIAFRTITASIDPAEIEQASEGIVTGAEPAFPPWLMAAMVAFVVGMVLGSYTATALTGETDDRNTD